MTTETNVERLENIKDNCEKLAKYERDYGSDDVNINPIVKDMEWLIRQAERVHGLEKALEFYADGQTYTDKQHTSSGELVGTGYLNILSDNGEIARQALEEST